MVSSLSCYQLLERLALQPIQTLSFPTHFAVVIKLKTAIANPDSTMRQIVDIVSSEPVVAARIIQLANAAVFYGNGGVTDLEKAIGRLGLATVKRVTLATAMYQLSHSKDMLQYSGLSRVLWLNSLYTAAAASIIAKELTSFSQDEASFLGLAVNLGAFYLLYQAATQHGLQRCSEDVQDALVRHHLQLSHRLLSHFDLPSKLTDAMDLEPMLEIQLSTVPKTLREVLYAAYVLGQRTYPWYVHDEAPGTLSEFFDTLTNQIGEKFQQLQAEFQR